MNNMSAVLKAGKRDSKSCSELNQLRNSGRIPGVLYGMNKENELIHVDQSEIVQVLRHHGRNSILELNLDENGPSEKVIIAEVQKDNLKDRILHLDFKRINMNKQMFATVPVTLIGQADGVKQGGVLQFQTRELEIRCLPSQLPESIPLYISELQVGELLTVQDLDIPPGVEVQHELNEVIVSVTPPRLQPVAEEDEEVKEPEIVGAKDGPGMDEAK